MSEAKTTQRKELSAEKEIYTHIQNEEIKLNDKTKNVKKKLEKRKTEYGKK